VLGKVTTARPKQWANHAAPIVGQGAQRSGSDPTRKDLVSWL